MHELLTAASAANPVAENAKGVFFPAPSSSASVWSRNLQLTQGCIVLPGSYMTMRSQGGLIFGILNIVGECSASFVRNDVGRKRSTASKPFPFGL